LTPVKKLAWAAGILVAIIVAVAVAFYERPLSFFNGLMYAQMAMAGAHSNYVTVDGIRMHYYTEGSESGAPVVLVHGLGGRCEDWRGLAPFLARSGFHVFMPDLPGYGRSEKPADFSYSIQAEASAVIGFIDAMGLKQIDLGGWSMGGWIVQEVAAAHPDRISRLVIFDSAGLHVAPAWDTRLFTPVSSVELDQLDTLLMPHPPRVPPFIAQDILRVTRRNAWVIHRALNAMLTGTDTTEKILPELKMPVLLVWGGLDRITPLQQGQQMRQLIPHAQMEVYPACGHLAPSQCADQIGPRVAEFLK
jgi:pimeloyl-ACP methyl ester carboxylesterase